MSHRSYGTLPYTINPNESHHDGLYSQRQWKKKFLDDTTKHNFNPFWENNVKLGDSENMMVSCWLEEDNNFLKRENIVMDEVYCEAATEQTGVECPQEEGFELISVKRRKPYKLHKHFWKKRRRKMKLLMIRSGKVRHVQRSKTADKEKLKEDQKEE